MGRGRDAYDLGNSSRSISRATSGPLIRQRSSFTNSAATACAGTWSPSPHAGEKPTNHEYAMNGLGLGNEAVFPATPSSRVAASDPMPGVRCGDEGDDERGGR